MALIVAVAACTGPPPAPSATTHRLDRAPTGRLDAAVDGAMKTASIPGAVVGVWGPDGDYVKAFGVADEATGTPMRSDVYQRIGSVTKTFTVTGILQLVDQGKLTLDDPIEKYVHGVPKGDEITLRDLADMRSGLADYSDSDAFATALVTDPRQGFTPQQLLDMAFAQPSTSTPGRAFEYCNTNTILLGLVIEKVSGQPLQVYLADRVTTPLGMSHTTLPVDSAFPNPHAQGYTTMTADGRETVATDWNPSWGGAAGAMISTLEDMRTWAPALATGKLLSPRMQAQRLQILPAPPSASGADGYGLGVFRFGGWLGHLGNVPGYQTAVFYLPEKQTTLVVFTNTSVNYQGSDVSVILATAITGVISPANVIAVAPH